MEYQPARYGARTSARGANLIPSRDLSAELATKVDLYNRYMTRGRAITRDWTLEERARILLGVAGLLALLGLLAFQAPRVERVGLGARASKSNDASNPRLTVQVGSSSRASRQRFKAISLVGQMVLGHPPGQPLPTVVPNSPRRMKNDEILSQISQFCRQADMAESTFGRRAVNDGKLVHRLREGKRITIDTLDRIQAYIAASTPGGVIPPRGLQVPPEKRDPRGNFRFFENRQKYLLFVHTCSEKRVVAERIGLELSSIHPRPPALRVFDAGVGDGTVLARVMRLMHGRFPHMPLYVAGKELSLEDVRLILEKVPDRLFEHPATVFVLTNMYYAEAPWLTPKSPAAAAGMIWHEVPLQGASSGEFEAQIADLRPFLDQNWRASVSPRTGMPIYERPVALVLYREDHRFLLNSIIPRAGRTEANFDLVIASQPYRAKSSVNFRAKRIIAPLARALRAGGRLIGITPMDRTRAWRLFRPSGPEKILSPSAVMSYCALSNTSWDRPGGT